MKFEIIEKNTIILALGGYQKFSKFWSKNDGTQCGQKFENGHKSVPEIGFF